MRGRVLAALACVVLSVVVAPGIAQAASPHKVTAYAQRIYNIDLRLYRSVSAIDEATVKADVAAVEAKLTCASELPADFSGQSQQVMLRIGDEFGFAYATGAMKRYFTLTSAAAARIAALPSNFPAARSFRKNATAVHSFIAAAQAVDACADLQTWKAAGFTTASEPVTTTQTAQLIAKQNPARSLKSAVVWITHSEYVRVKQAKARAAARYAQITAEMQAALKKFFTAAGIPVP
jgi:hypothetical protein